MSAPYRNFWIIVGMTAGAIVLANFSAKPEKAKTSADKSSYQSTKPIFAPTSSQEAHPQTQNASQVSATPKNARNEPNTAGSASSAGRQLRKIDEDIKRAFDEATQIALGLSVVSASPLPKETDPKNSDLPALVTREVSERPEIAGVSADTQAAEIHEYGKSAETKTNLNMREGPGPKYLLLETLPTGVTVSILGEEAGWVRVRLKDAGREGWVNPSYLERH
jgi:hypothetical protein